ncbi:hypothetical protein RRG08_046941 [Elysia crispata]|uniref:Uncharacterized protein n=1 Tax=Elysia crispata TaxID=231223 RepID=A0AAE1AAJ9_9GAST|nr:hypothetical protein RRG08_046941 [Elysia crispata]
MPIHVVRIPMKLFWPVLHCLKREDIREATNVATLAATGLMEYSYFGPKGKLPYLLHPANWRGCSNPAASPSASVRITLQVQRGCSNPAASPSASVSDQIDKGLSASSLHVLQDHKPVSIKIMQSTLECLNIKIYDWVIRIPPPLLNLPASPPCARPGLGRKGQEFFGASVADEKRSGVLWGLCSWGEKLTRKGQEFFGASVADEKRSGVLWGKCS